MRIRNTIIIFIIASFFWSVHALAYSPASAYEGKLISNIGISGNYPYVENKIRRYLTVRPSDVYNQSILSEQSRRIVEFYKRDGWFDTEVRIVPEYLPYTDSISLHIKIKRGYLLRFRNIVVTGNNSLPLSLVPSKINVLRPYKPSTLRESIQNIVHTYRMKGYPLARARVTNKTIDQETHRIDVEIQVDEGPHVEIAFQGNKHIGGKQLAGILTIFKEGAIDSYELETSAKEIRRRYLYRGFPNATVNFRRVETGPDKLKITFYINEGKPERIRAIKITGDTIVSENAVRRSMESKSLSLFHQGIYVPEELENDEELIADYYASIGFPDTKVSSPGITKEYDGTQLVVSVPVNEGPQYTLNNIIFEGNFPFRQNKLNKIIESKIGKPLDYTLLEYEKLNIISFLADNGYPYSSVVADVVENTETGAADLYFKIDPGPLVVFGNISIQGDFITSQKAIYRAINIREGDPFSYKAIVDSKIGLRRLDAFASVEIRTDGIENKETVIPVLIKVEEMRPFKLDFDLGFSTDERLIGGIAFLNRNAFGWGKSATLNLLGGKRLSRGEIAWIDPKLGGYDLEMTTSSWLQYENKAVYNYIQAGGGVGLYRRYHRTSFLVRVNLNRNYFISGSSTAADADSLRNNTMFNTLLSMTFDTRNNFADPLRGNVASGYTNFFNEIKGKNAHFVKFGVIGGNYFTLFEKFTFANDARLENIQTFGKDVSIPSNELYLLGGDTTIRGFPRDSLGPVDAAGRATGGRLRFVCNNELRIALLGNFKWVVFHDMGFLTDAYSAVDLGQLRHSGGFGLHYITPIGPIKADYGFILDRKPGDSVGRFHLTFGYVF